MTVPLATIAAEERADARFYEQIAAHYRAYLAYLEAHLALLDIQAARASVAFERAEARDDEERTARATLAAIQPANRALFDAVVEQERLEVQEQLAAHAQSAERSRSADPDEAARLALRLLRDEANGIGTEGGKGLVPRGTPEAIKWYAVDVAALRSAPTAAAYAAGTTDARRRKRVLWQAGAAGVVILVALTWLFLPRGGVHPTATAAHTAVANGAPLSAWPVRSIVVTAAHGDTVTVPVSATSALTWPGGDTPTRAYWRTTSIWPLQLCLPAALLATATDVRLAGSGANPDRVYTLTATSPTAVDLVITPCQSSHDVPAPRMGVLHATAPVPVHAIGQTATIAQGPITPTAITLIGPGQDPTIPADQARVSVQVRAPRNLDWPLLAPTLLLPSGAAALPSDFMATTQGAELRYLVPLPEAPLAVLWSIAPRADRIPTLRPELVEGEGGASLIRWRATLDPPPARAAVLRAALAVERVQAAPGDAPGTIALTMIVANRSTTPLQLTGADISLTQTNQPIATPDLAALRQPLTPGERRTLALDAPLGERETLILTVGVACFAIARTEGR